MTVKETLVEALRKVGYDFITACEIAHEQLQEFLKSDQKEKTFVVHDKFGKCTDAFVVKKKGN